MKIAVVTGASSGFGRIFVSELQKCCKTLDEIWVVARRKERGAGVTVGMNPFNLSNT